MCPSPAPVALYMVLYLLQCIGKLPDLVRYIKVVQNSGRTLFYKD